MTHASSTNETIDRIVQTIEEIPTLPVIASQIRSLLKNDDTTVKHLENIIMRDPPLAAKILKLVNSSFYGLLNKVSTIEHALVILGFQEVRNVVLGFSLQNHFPDDNATIDRTRFWKHAIVCSQIAKYLGKHFRIPDDGTFFLSGLIHDIGKLVIDQYFPDEFVRIVETVSTGQTTFSQAEKSVLGVTHYQIGAKLLQQWQFPPRVVMQVFYHHAPWHDKNFTSESIVVYLANMFTKMTGYSCLAEEKHMTGTDITDTAICEFLNKNGFELDCSSYEHLLGGINEFLAAERTNVLSIFD